jgi:hypothetical protein
MLGASVLPWLVDPLGRVFPAWQLPVDIGWQLHFNLFSYGLLCLLCSLYAFFISYLIWQEENYRNNLLYGQTEKTTAPPLPPRRGRGLSLPTPPNHAALRTHSTLAGILCLMPISLFLTQYLFIDMASIAQLAQHEFQALLIQKHFGYRVAAPFTPIQLDTFDPSTLSGRLALLLNQIQPGLYLPFLGTLCLTGKGPAPFHTPIVPYPPPKPNTSSPPETTLMHLPGLIVPARLIHRWNNSLPIILNVDRPCTTSTQHNTL